MGQRLRASEAPPEDPDLIPDTHMVTQTLASVTPVPEDQTIYAITDCDVYLGGHFGYLWDQPKCKQQSSPVRDFLDWTIWGGKTCPKSWAFNIRRPTVNVGSAFW